MTLDEARRPNGRGGWRPNAGRKKKPGAIPHDARPRMPSRFPQHVTLRVVADGPTLAREWLMKIIRRAIAQSHKPYFRVVEFNVLGNHVHLITEASDALMLGLGVGALEVRLARRLNSATQRRGKLFAHRYHVRYLRTPTQVRNTLRYVLLNRKHHAAEQRFSRYWIDPFSSAAWFTGWATPIRVDTWWKQDLVERPARTAKPRTWLLAAGWQRHGPLRFDDAPA